MKQERTRKTPNVWQACVILVCVIAAVVAAIKTGVGMVDKILSRSPINFLQAAERCSAACDYPKGLSLRASRRLAQQSASSSPGPLRAAGPTGRFGDFSVPQAELLLVKSALFAAQFTRHARYTTKKERHLDGCS